MAKKKPHPFRFLDDVLGFVGLAMVMAGLYLVHPGWLLAAAGGLVIWIALRLPVGEGPEPEEE